MSRRNGDRSRFNRERKAGILRRERNRELKKRLTNPTPPQPAKA
jgi:hypothetical protein